ncbi:unnamed protein product, partial [Porites lobata]
VKAKRAAQSCLETPRNHWLPVQSATTSERLICQLLYFVNMVTESMITFLLIVASIEARQIQVRRNLGDVCQKMWNAAGNNMVVGTDMTVNTSSTATNLFTVTSTGQTKLQQPVYTSFKALLDNYISDETKPEIPASQKSQEEDNFINTIAVEGGPVDIAFKYLKTNGKTTATDLNAFKAVLKMMWFAKNAKGELRVRDYSGFKHTFFGVLGVNKEGKTVVKGLHNWYQFLLEQTAGRLAYSPPQKNVDTTKKPPFINVQFTWNGVSKTQGSSFYVGTSPAFEMALYTACFFGEPGYCTCNVDRNQLKIKTFNFHNAGMVLTSYPVA